MARSRQADNYVRQAERFLAKAMRFDARAVWFSSRSADVETDQPAKAVALASVSENRRAAADRFEAKAETFAARARETRGHVHAGNR